MVRVVVERLFEQPQTFAALQAKEDAAQSCLTAWRVRFLYSYLSRDGLRMVCLYKAPDAEAVRQAQKTADLPYTHVYTCQGVVDEQPERPAGYSLVVAQRALPGLSRAEVEVLAQDAAGCMQRMRLVHFGAFLSLDGSRMVCVYYTPDLDSVRRANREASLPYEQLWLAERFDAASSR